MTTGNPLLAATRAQSGILMILDPTGLKLEGSKYIYMILNVRLRVSELPDVENFWMCYLKHAHPNLDR